MKKFYHLLTLVFVAGLFVACSQDEPQIQKNDEVMNTTTLDLQIGKPQFDGVVTRSAALWEEGDVVNLLFEREGGVTVGVASYNANDKTWTINYYGSLDRDKQQKVKAFYFENSGEISSTDVALNPTTGVYVDTAATYIYPTNGKLAVMGNLLPVTSRIRFKGEVGTKIEIGGLKSFKNYAKYTGLLTDTTQTVTVTVQSNGYTPYVYSTLADKASRLLSVKNGETTYLLNCSNDMFKIGESGWMDTPTMAACNGWRIAISKITLNQTSAILGIVDDDKTLQLQANIQPSYALNKSLVWTSSNPDIVTVENGTIIAHQLGDALITVASQELPNIKTECKISVKPLHNDHEFVDLGLPSGTLWATMNVGAEKPEDYGNYYAWGEIIGQLDGKRNFCQSTYKFCNSLGELMKYKTIPCELDNIDDAAHSQWGGMWSIPALFQFEELTKYCSRSTKIYTNVIGDLFTSIKNGNCIFFPYAGHYVNYDRTDQNIQGLYWLNFKNNSETYAKCMKMINEEISVYDLSIFWGASVRAVIIQSK